MTEIDCSGCHNKIHTLRKPGAKIRCRICGKELVVGE